MNAMKERGGDVIPTEDGKFTYDSIEAGGTNSVDISVSEDAVLVAHLHTPDSKLNPYKGENDSANEKLSSGRDGDDIRNFDKYIEITGNKNIPQMIGTPSGRIRMRTKDNRKYREVAPKGTLTFRRPKEKKN